MKRWKKALSGLLMAALMVTGISFPENVFAVSAGMDGLPSVVDSGIGKKVDTNSTIDGTYNFTPVIGANTKVSFGVQMVRNGIISFALMVKNMHRCVRNGGHYQI